MRLADFILENMEPILRTWQDFARTLPPAGQLNRKELRDHAELMLKDIAKDLTMAQSAHEQSEKSKGFAPQESGITAAETHGAERLLAGFSVNEMVSEYRALRASVLRLWDKRVDRVIQADLDDMTRFNEAIDQALAESVSRYAAMVKQSQNLFLAILGHDLRNPLGAIIMSADYLVRVDPQADATQYNRVASQIMASGERMREMVNNLLDYTRTHFGAGIPIVPAAIDIAIVCRDVVEEMRALHPTRTISLDAPGTLAAVADSPRLGQMLSNLIGNALQHGSWTTPIKVIACNEPGYVSVMVHNDGVPIPAQEIAHIFDPLMRYSAVAQTNPDPDASLSVGLGLGLYIAREIILAHGGTIAVQSTAEEGTIFTARLPVA